MSIHKQVHPLEMFPCHWQSLNQLQNHADGLQPRPAKHIPSNKNKITTPNNHFSVSLQVAKNRVCKQNKKAAHIPAVSPHHIEPTETTPVSSAENVQKMSKNPPLNSKQRAKDETCEEFFSKHIVFFKNHMLKHYGYLSSPAALPHLKDPDQPSFTSVELTPPTTYSTTNDLLQHPKHFLDHYLINSKLT
ncbi:hypothetical protein J6590_068912 [Homalodisca vitripennis]|nr:hypothetical protein J6590_068912 [Homalodisca vitripennis]